MNGRAVSGGSRSTNLNRRSTICGREAVGCGEGANGMNLRYETDRIGGVVKVLLAGELDLSNVDELNDVLTATIGRPDTTTVDVD